VRREVEGRKTKLFGKKQNRKGSQMEREGPGGKKGMNVRKLTEEKTAAYRHVHLQPLQHCQRNGRGAVQERGVDPRGGGGGTRNFVGGQTRRGASPGIYLRREKTRGNWGRETERNESKLRKHNRGTILHQGLYGLIPGIDEGKR